MSNDNWSLPDFSRWGIGGLDCQRRLASAPGSLALPGIDVSRPPGIEAFRVAARRWRIIAYSVAAAADSRGMSAVLPLLDQLYGGLVDGYPGRGYAPGYRAAGPVWVVVAYGETPTAAFLAVLDFLPAADGSHVARAAAHDVRCDEGYPVEQVSVGIGCMECAARVVSGAEHAARLPPEGDSDAG